MSPAVAYAALLGLLGGWGLFTARPLWRAARPWRLRHWHLLIAEVLLISGCWLSAIALATDRFSGWMLLPIGVSYALMVPLPCYFAVVDRVPWIHVLRNAVFAAVTVACVAIAFGFVPISILGLD